MLKKFLCLVWPKYRRNQQRIAWLILEGWEPYGFEGWAKTELHGLRRGGIVIYTHGAMVDYGSAPPQGDSVGWKYVHPTNVDHFYRAARKVKS
jgi:hypothetical protein